MTLSTPKAELTGVFLESLAYGVYLSIYIQCIQVLQRRHSGPGDYLFGTAVSLFILITAHLVVDIMRNMDAFTSHMDTANYPIQYYKAFNSWKDILKSALYVSATIISDAFILYRSFIVWGRNYFVVIIPFLLLLADVAIGTLWVYTLNLIHPGSNVFADVLTLRVKVFYSITLCINVICTCLIAFKVWQIQRAVAPFVKGSQDNMSRLLAIVIESGSAYSAVLVVMLATYASKSPAMFIFLNSMSPIIGIVFSSVIVRVGLGLSHGDSHNMRSMTSSGGSRMPWAVRTQHTASRYLVSPSPLGFGGGGVQVSLSQTVHTHVDGLQEDEVEVDKIADDTPVGSPGRKPDARFGMV